jgi:hypothetical protein
MADVPALAQVKQAWESVELPGRASSVLPDPPSTSPPRPQAGLPPGRTSSVLPELPSTFLPRLQARPSQVTTAGPAAERLPGTVGRGAKPSSVPPSTVEVSHFGPVPLAAYAQVEPWGHRDDFRYMVQDEWPPGVQEVYKELRTGQRRETGGWPIRPEIASSMLKPAANNELFQEGFNRSANDPEWKSAIERGFDAKRSYVQDKALDLTGETDFRRRQTPH